MPHPFYNFFVGLAGSGLAEGGPGAKESALAPELGRGRAEPGCGITRQKSRDPKRSPSSMLVHLCESYRYTLEWHPSSQRVCSNASRDEERHPKIG